MRKADHDHDDVLLQQALEESVEEATAEPDALHEAVDESIREADDGIILPKPEEGAGEDEGEGIKELDTAETLYQ